MRETKKDEKKSVNWVVHCKKCRRQDYLDLNHPFKYVIQHCHTFHFVTKAALETMPSNVFIRTKMTMLMMMTMTKNWPGLSKCYIIPHLKSMRIENVREKDHKYFHRRFISLCLCPRKCLLKMKIFEEW